MQTPAHYASTRPVAGSYVFVPKGSRHFAVARGNVVQIHGIGPFKAVFVH
jgi:hypothetical protein